MSRSRFAVLTSTAFLLWLGCGDSPVGSGGADPPTANRPDPLVPVADADRQTVKPLVIVLGDSLSAGLGVAEDAAFPALTASALARKERPIRLINAGISGDTTAGGLNRLPWLLAQKPAVVVVELGANDGLRGLSLADTEGNLDRIVRRCLAAGARVLLVGMKLPPSYGPEYAAEFEKIFVRLADRHAIDRMPFLLEGVAAVPELNQADGIHPNQRGHAMIAEAFTPYLERMLEDLAGSPIRQSLD